MEKIRKHHKIIIVAVVILISGGALVWGKYGHSIGQSSLPYSFVQTTQGDFVREIKLTGTVKAASDIQLSFARSGKTDTVAVKAGDQVKAGAVIASLVKTDLSADYLAAVAQWQMAKAQVAQAQANLSAQRIKKQDLLNGAKSEDVAVSETQVASAAKGFTDAQTALSNVKAQADASLNTLYAKIDNSLAEGYDQSYDIVYHSTEAMFADSVADNPQLSFTTPLDSQAKMAAETARISAMAAVKKLAADRSGLASDYSNYAAVFSAVDGDLAVMGNYLDNLNNALNYATAGNNFSQSDIAADQTITSAAVSSNNATRAALDGLKQAVDLQIKINQNNIFAAQAGVDQAQNAVNLANDQLTLKKSGATTLQVSMQDEQIKQAQAALAAALAQQTAAAANIAKAQAQLDNATIIAPIDGVITFVNLDPGEAMNAAVPVIGLQSAGKFQVETYLPELYVGEVKAGDAAKISFDAFGNDRIFDAKVISVDPAAQMNNNTLAYRTLLEFVNEEAEIKTGLTANIQIIAADDKNILSVPESSVIKDGEKNFVILASGEKREVAVGKTNGGGRIEILSGLTVGEAVADFGNK